MRIAVEYLSESANLDLQYNFCEFEIISFLED